YLGDATDHVRGLGNVEARLTVAAMPEQHGAQAGAVCTGDVLRQRVADEQRLAGLALRAAQGFGEDPAVGLARARLLARQEPVEIAREAGELAQMAELVGVDFADDAEPQAAATKLRQRFHHAFAELKIALVKPPLQLAVAPEVLRVGLAAELAKHC